MGDYDLHDFFVAMRKADNAYRYRRPVTVVTDPRRAMARAAEKEAAMRLLLEGYAVTTRGHNSRYDLLIDGCLRVEVKCSRWDGRRYQTHYHNRADVLCWLLANTGQWLIIPVSRLGSRSNLAIWSYDANDYNGQWANYLGAWSWVSTLAADRKRAGVSIAYQQRLF